MGPLFYIILISSLSLADEGHIGYKDTNKTTPTLQAWLGIVCLSLYICEWNLYIYVSKVRVRLYDFVAKIYKLV